MECLTRGLPVITGKWNPNGMEADAAPAGATGGAAVDNDDETDCALCIAGTYNEDEGSFDPADCLVCEVGKYVEGTGHKWESDCLECAEGKHNEKGVEAPPTCTETAVTSVPADRDLCADVTGSDLTTDATACEAALTSASDDAGTTACTYDTHATDGSGNNEETDCIDCAKGRFVGRRAGRLRALREGRVH